MISIVIPLYNESAGIASFHNDVLMPELNKDTKEKYEIIYVNDGSGDSTLEIITKIAEKQSNVKVVNLSRNFGKELATTAGISVSSGEATIILDGDGQHPPRLIPEFINKWQAGAQVVIGVRATNAHEGIIKKWGSKAFYRMFNASSGAKLIPRSTDFRLISAPVREEFLRCTERYRITRGLIDWLGFQRAYIAFDPPARLAGTASYRPSQLVMLAVNSFVSLSLKPLFFFSILGGVITAVSLIAGVFLFIEQLLLSDPLGLKFTGSAMLGIFISFLVGIVLLSQGILAMYLYHLQGQTQARPLFIIDKATSKL
jgi:dolichol-phosphate mannosyltransferase